MTILIDPSALNGAKNTSIIGTFSRPVSASAVAIPHTNITVATEADIAAFTSRQTPLSDAEQATRQRALEGELMLRAAVSAVQASSKKETAVPVPSVRKNHLIVGDKEFAPFIPDAFGKGIA